MNNEESIMHKIKVDDNITMEIAIPKIMNALQFKGLTMKANKLFNLSEASFDILPKQKIIHKSLDESLYEKNKRASMRKNKQLFILRKHFIENISAVKILNLFKNELPDIKISLKAIYDLIYAHKKNNTESYKQVMKEKNKNDK